MGLSSTSKKNISDLVDEAKSELDKVLAEEGADLSKLRETIEKIINSID